MYPLTYNRFDLYHQNNINWIAPAAQASCYGKNKLFFKEYGNKILYGVQIEKGFKDCLQTTDAKYQIRADWDSSLAIIKNGRLDNFANDQYDLTFKNIKIDIDIMSNRFNQKITEFKLNYNAKGISGTHNLTSFHILVVF